MDECKSLPIMHHRSMKLLGTKFSRLQICSACAAPPHCAWPVTRVRCTMRSHTQSAGNECMAAAAVVHKCTVGNLGRCTMGQVHCMLTYTVMARVQGGGVSGVPVHYDKHICHAAVWARRSMGVTLGSRCLHSSPHYKTEIGNSMGTQFRV